ncbi:MAG: PAS domain S-box protein [Acidobacteriota bacterium]
MLRRRFSVATIVAATLVTVTTLLLGAFGVAKYFADRTEKWDRLQRVDAAIADVLAVSLALPIWNIDRAQIDKIIGGMSATPSVQAVVVTAAGKTHSHVRVGPWLMPTDRPFPTEGLLVEERPIVFNNQRIGTVRLYATPKYVRAELRRTLLTMVGAFLLLELMLVLSVYFVLWRTVLRPLASVQEYATAVSEGRAVAETAGRAGFPAELEALYSCIESMVAALQEGEQRFRTIFDSANDAIFLTDPATGRIADVNSRIADMYGYSREEAMNMEIAQLSSGVEPYTQEGALAVIEKALSGEPQVFEWHARHRDGHLFWVEGSTRMATIEGRPRLIVVVRDITQRKEMESALKAEKDFMDAAINTIMGVFFVRDSAGRLIRWNKTMEAVRGVGGDELENDTGLPAIHPDDRPLVEAKIAEVFERGYAETEARVVVGSPLQTRHFLLNGKRMIRGGEAFMVSTGIDITDRKRVEAERERLQTAIERSAVEWRQTFDSVRTPIIITDGKGVVRRLNDAAAELAERVMKEIPGTPLSALGDGPWRIAAELIPSFDGIQASAEAHDAFGRTWDVHLGRLYSPGSDGSLIVVFWEITGIVALQDSLRRSERMSAMGALVAGVAHEVRNPLFGMSALLDAYAEEMSDPDLEQFAAGLRQQVTRLTHLMRELLEFGKPVAISLFPEALSGVVEEAVIGRTHAASEAQVTLRNAVDPLLPAVPMDRGRLRQVFENLIDNALQHAPAVRTVTISARGSTSIECTVEDDGAGFAPDDLPHVFEPFFTRRERGTGLGLSIVHRIVEEHAGRVSASNRVAGGAVITMHFPAVGPSSAASRHLLPLAREKAI